MDDNLLGHTSDPEFEKLSSDPIMEALRDKTVHVELHYFEEKMELQELLTERNKHYDAIKELDAKIKVAGIDDLKTKLKGVFEEHPSCEEFAWTQYTDYFNDGDTCHFHVHRDGEMIYVNGECGWDKELTEEEVKVQDDVTTILDSWSDDDLKMFFGDHKKIVVTKDEVAVESYTSHD